MLQFLQYIYCTVVPFENGVAIYSWSNCMNAFKTSHQSILPYSYKILYNECVYYHDWYKYWKIDTNTFFFKFKYSTMWLIEGKEEGENFCRQWHNKIFPSFTQFIVHSAKFRCTRKQPSAPLNCRLLPFLLVCSKAGHNKIYNTLFLQLCTLAMNSTCTLVHQHVHDIQF